MKHQLITLLAVLCVTAWAPQQSAAQSFSGGTGAENTPYLISTIPDLAQLATDVNAGTDYDGEYFQLTVGLDLDVSPYNAGTGWTPIGTFDKQFKGTFNGAGHTISHLFISDLTLDYAGLFGVIGAGGAVHNLGIVNGDITARDYAGSVAGGVTYGSLADCYATGTITARNYAGGVAGGVEDGNLTGCYATATVTATESYIGGVVGGINASSLTNCYATGAVTGRICAGGVVGYMRQSSLTNCHATGAITITNEYVGGVAGRMELNSNLTGCYATGTVTGGNGVAGGVAGGINGSSVADCYATGAVSGMLDIGGVIGAIFSGGSLTNSYATGAVSGQQNIGGVAGVVDNGSATHCYATGAVSGARHVGGVAGIIDVSSITHCAALNPSVEASFSDVGRVVGKVFSGVSDLSANIAFSGISAGSGVPLATDPDLQGADITAVAILTDGTLGGRFTTGWTTAAGRLPGLGATVDMPAYLRVPLAPESLEATSGDLQVKLAWEAPTANGSAVVVRYEYAYATTAHPTNWADNGMATTVTVTGLTKGLRYYFSIRAVNDMGDGVPADITATPLFTVGGYDVEASCPLEQQGSTSTLVCDATLTDPDTGTGIELSPGSTIEDDGAGHALIRPGDDGITVTYPDGETAYVPDDGSVIILDPAWPGGLLIVGEATAPNPVLRWVTLRLPAGVAAQPAAGMYSIRSGSDFTFTLTLPTGYVPVVQTNRLLNGEPEVIVAVPNADGSYTFTVRQVRRTLEITVTTDTGNEAVTASQVWTHGGRLYVRTANPYTLYIYTPAGQLYRQQQVDAGETAIDLPQGFYIVAMDGRRWKVTVH